MASAARRSLGTLLKIGDGGGSEVFTTIAEVLDISGPAVSLATEDVTSHDSTWREHIGTLLEGGEITFDVNFTNAATQGFSAGLYADMVARTVRNFQLVIPFSSAKTGSFAAIVTGFQPNTAVEGVIRASVTLLVSGAITWA